MQFEYKRKEKQHILLDDKGFILASCDSIFSTKNLRNKPIFTHFPLVESIYIKVISMGLNDPKLRFSKIESTFEGLDGYYDFTFVKTDIDYRNPILWTILDYTMLYEDFHRSQQERQELAIARELLEAESGN